MRQAFLWGGALAIAASLLVASDYRSRDPDSALYARLSGELAQEPPSRWIAPEWRGAWDHEGLFREHPVGILLPSVLLIRAGVPAGQAAYIVNMLYQAAVIALVPLVAGVLVRGLEARTLAWVLQLLPVAFVYRIRANQEHPLLMCFLAVIYATERARTHPRWIALTIVAFGFLVLVKGAFAMFTLVAAALWLLIVPAPAGAADRWAWTGLAAAALASLLMMTGYEALYVRTTGESFLEFYRSTRLGQSIQLTDPRVVPHALVNAGWYLLRLAWFAAPWSLACLRGRRPLAPRRGAGTCDGAVRGRQQSGHPVGRADNGGVHRRVESSARPRRAVHLPGVLRDRGGGSGDGDPDVRGRRPSGAAGRSVHLAAGRGLDGDVPSQSGQ